MTSKRAASSTPTLSHATPRHIPGSASSENLHLHRERQRRASGTPTSLPRRDSDLASSRPTRARVGPLPKNGPGNPLFPPLPPKASKPRRESQMSQLERMDSANKIEEGEDNEQGDHRVKEEGEKEPEDWEEYSQKQRKQRGFANAGEEAETDPKGDEQQAKEEDHETMTSGLSENEVGNETGEDGEVDDAVETKSTATVTAETQHASPEPSEAKPQQDDNESQSSSEKRSLRTRAAAESSSTHPTEEPHQPEETIDVDMDRKPSPEDTEDARKEDDDGFSPDGLIGKETAGQVDANGDVTRCICGREADIDAMMIQCDHCNVWQHGACVGIWGDEEAPDEYFCELCKPNLHAPLKRFLRHRQKQGLGFAVPTPGDLKHHHHHSDRIKPSQSKRWTDPSVIKDESMSPPPATTVPSSHSKPTSAAHGASARSHKAKAHSPVVDTRRSVGAGHRALSSVSDKAHPDFKVPGSHSARPGGGTSTRRFSNTSSSDSPTSATGAVGANSGGKGKDVPLGPVKKRSTMNSRDAAYEEAIAASLREAGGSGVAGEPGAAGTRSRRAVTETQEYGQEEDEAKKGKKSTSSSASAAQSAASRGVKRSRQDEEEVDEAGDDVYVAGGSRKGKKKKDESDGKSPNKPKHPNQYTYRPKNGTSGSSTATPTQATLAPPEKVRTMPHSPSKKQAPSAASGSNPASRRLGGGGTRGGTPSSVAGSTGGQGSGSGAGTGTSLSWNLPDHLAPFAYTLPPNPPSLLEIITPRPSQTGKTKSTDPTPSAHDPGTGEPPTHFEAPTKIRYPTKRMTIGEMRKRVRNLLEFVGRVQGEEDKRGERAQLLELGGQPVNAEGATVGEATRTEESKVVEAGEDASTQADGQAMDVDGGASEHVKDGKTESSQAEGVITRDAAVDRPVQMNVDEGVVPAPPTDPALDNKANAAAGDDSSSNPVPNTETARETQQPAVGTTKPELEAAQGMDMATPAMPAESSAAQTLPVSDADVPTPTVPPPSAPTASTSAVEPTQLAPPPPQQQQSKSSQLLAELTSDLIKFQMMFEVGGSVFAAPPGGGMNGGAGGVEEE